MTLTMTDLFCGAGGSSSGAIQVPGVEVRMAANHWDLAVRTHNTNHPATDHDCADISQVNPRRYPATDLLWASPECTNHSQAKGRKRADRQPDLYGEVLPDDAGDRSRATMFDVCRFVEVGMLRGQPYRGFVVENVVEVRDWIYFDAWRMALETAGYCLHFVCLNSAYAQGLGQPAPQSRDRAYIVGHLATGRCPDLNRWTRPAAWCPRCEQVVSAVQAWKRPDRPAWGRHRKQYVYRCPNVACRNGMIEPAFLPASTVIDWSLLGARIGGRRRPLAASTLDRIRQGLRKYGRQLAVPVEGRSGVSARPLDWPFRTQTSRHETALLVPAGGSWNDDAIPTTEPFRTRTTRESEAVVMHPALLLRNQNSRGGQMCTPVDEPMRTVMASSRQSLLQMPWMVVDYNGPARPITDPLPTQTTVEGDGVCSIEEAIEDCLFRMLTPGEIQGAMAFDPAYEVLGNKREQVRQLGNAVTPPAARDLIAALAEAITGEEVAA